MIQIEKLRQVTTIYTHAHCPDGLAGAMILKDAFRMLGMAPRIEFLTHGSKEHAQAAMAGEGVSLFCDFAPTPDIAQLTKDTGTVIVLDHHVGAKDIVESFGENGIYADAEKEPGVSGAVLAFREVWMSILNQKVLGPEHAKEPKVEVYRAVRDFAECVGARDTWQTADHRFARGQHISKFLMSKPAAYWLGPEQPEHPSAAAGDHVPYLTDGEVEMGRALFEAHENAVAQAVEQCAEEWVRNVPLRFSDKGDDIMLFVFQEQASGFRLCSDVTEALRKKFCDYPLRYLCYGVVAGFSYVVNGPALPGRQAKPSLIYSLRGLNGFDVCAFAKANGGGGHKAAAGFSLPADEVDFKGPYAHIRIALSEFLRGRVS